MQGRCKWHTLSVCIFSVFWDMIPRPLESTVSRDIFPTARSQLTTQPSGSCPAKQPRLVIVAKIHIRSLLINTLLTQINFLSTLTLHAMAGRQNREHRPLCMPLQPVAGICNN